MLFQPNDYVAQRAQIGNALLKREHMLMEEVVRRVLGENQQGGHGKAVPEFVHTEVPVQQ